MNNRFNFRVWDNNKKEYLDKGYIHRKGYLVMPTMKNDYSLAEAEGDFIIEQCTGLKDKNGKLIYENDIVAKEFYDRPFSIKAKTKIKNCVVCWSNSGQFSIEYKSDDYRYYSTPCDSFIGHCEVIGNIHENYELLDDNKIRAKDLDNNKISSKEV